MDDNEEFMKSFPRRARTFSTKKTIIRRNKVFRPMNGTKPAKVNQNYKKKYHEIKKKYAELEVVTKIVTLENQKLKKKLNKNGVDSPGLPKRHRPSAFLEQNRSDLVTPTIRDNIIQGKHASLIKKQLIEMKKINIENRLRLKLCSLLSIESVLYRDQRIEIRASSSAPTKVEGVSGSPIVKIKLNVRNVSATKIFCNMRMVLSENERIFILRFLKILLIDYLFFFQE